MIRFYKFLSAIALALAIIVAPAVSFAQVSIGIGVNIDTPPPALPVYEQPPCPVEGYLWTPGFWSYGAYGYYWVPGTWVAPPQPGYLWTPGYWSFGGGYYGWHPGYWGLHVGFYGGVNYGFGYGGIGYVGGGWFGNAFRYNTAVTNVNTTVINNTYVDKTVIVNNSTTNNVSYNGGPNGIQAHPSPEELNASHEPHFQATPEQRLNARTAGTNRNYFESVNNGHPDDAAVSAPLTRENHPQSFAPVTTEDRANRNPAFASKPPATSAFHDYHAPSNETYRSNRSTGNEKPTYAPRSYHRTGSTHASHPTHPAPEHERG